MCHIGSTWTVRSKDPDLVGKISTYLRLGELLGACYLARVAAAPKGSPQNRPRAWRPLYR